MATSASWRDNLANAQSGDYLLTKLENGYRLWRVEADGRVGGEELHPEIAALFARLNAATDSHMGELESASDDDDEEEDR